MGGRLTRAVVAGLLLVTALAACSPDDEPAAPTATLGTAPPVTPTTDPYAVPPVIDAAYVNRVLEALDAAVGEVVRIVVREKRIPQEAADRLQALYLDERRIQLELDSFQDDMRDNFRSYRTEPGNQDSTVLDLISGTPTCIFAKIRRDYSMVGTAIADNSITQWVGLKPRDPSRDLRGFNPTPWAIVVDGFQQDLSQPKNPCGA